MYRYLRWVLGRAPLRACGAPGLPLLLLLLLCGARPSASQQELVVSDGLANSNRRQARQLVGLDRCGECEGGLRCAPWVTPPCVTHDCSSHIPCLTAPVHPTRSAPALHTLPLRPLPASSPAIPGGGGGAPLIVTLLDGVVVGVDRDAGRVLWTFDSGAPLVSAKQSPQGSGFNVFPGVDGGLYAYHGVSKHRTPGLEVRAGLGFSGRSRQNAAGQGRRIGGARWGACSKRAARYCDQLLAVSACQLVLVPQSLSPPPFKLCAAPTSVAARAGAGGTVPDGGRLAHRGAARLARFRS
jgi:hypothetical protein